MSTTITDGFKYIVVMEYYPKSIDAESSSPVIPAIFVLSKILVVFD
jgi:hypothetical protein